jgi:Flp pilus assembly protein CpaB
MPVRPRWRRRWRAWARRSSIGWWIAVALLGIVTVVVVRSSLEASAGATARSGSLRRVPVVVAPVPAGAEVPASAVELADRPGSTVPDADVARAWDGRTALVDLVPGEVLLAARVAPDGVVGAAALLPAGQRALAVAGGPGGRPPLRIGDHVDLLATLAAAPDDAAGGRTEVVAEDALVLHVDEEADTVTVAVPAEEAPAVASAVATGTVTLALSGPAPRP